MLGTGFHRITTLAGRYFDFDLHPGVRETGRDHGRRGPDVAQILPEHRPAWLEIFDSWQDVANPNYIGKPAASLLQGYFDIDKTALCLLDNVIGDGHCLVVEPGGARDEDPFAIHDGT